MRVSFALAVAAAGALLSFAGAEDVGALDVGAQETVVAVEEEVAAPPLPSEPVPAVEEVSHLRATKVVEEETQEPTYVKSCSRQREIV